jgi:uncharacterized protein (TIGR03663 family)
VESSVLSPPDEPESNRSLWLALCAVLLLTAIVTRFYGLGVKPPHHDESMHAFYSLQIVKTGDYEYNPMMHGPFQFYGNAAMFYLFGDNTAVSRYLAASFGVLAVFLALLMSPFLGRAGAFLAALMLAFSPGFMYFNRFCREDTYFATAVLALVVFLLRYLKDRRPWDLWLAALALAVAYCTKETIFITLAIFWSWFFIRFIKQALRDGEEKTGEGPSKPAFDLDLPAFAIAVGIFGLVFTLLFSSFFTIGSHDLAPYNRVTETLRTLWNGAFGAIQYWMGQHSVHRGDQPFYYYFLQLLANEPLCFLFTIPAALYYLFINKKTLPRFLAYWALGSFLLYTWFGEKMPWLTLHIVLPSILLVAYFLGEVWDSLWTTETHKGLRTTVLALAGLLFLYTGWTATRLCFQDESNPAEPYVYVQSTPDCLEVERIVREISKDEGQGTGMLVTIQDKCSWPFAWLFRDFDNRNHPSAITSVKDTKFNVMIPCALTAVESDAAQYPLLEKAGYVNRRYKLRAWWLYSWFKKGAAPQAMSFPIFVDWLFRNGIPLMSHRDDMVGWDELGRWVINREVWTDKGSYDMRLWVRGDLARKYGFTADPTGELTKNP